MRHGKARFVTGFLALPVLLFAFYVVWPFAQTVGYSFTDWGGYFPIDVALSEAKPDDFDALLLPGGVLNPDRLRMQPRASNSSGASSTRSAVFTRPPAILAEAQFPV